MTKVTYTIKILLLDELTREFEEWSMFVSGQHSAGRDGQTNTRQTCNEKHQSSFEVAIWFKVQAIGK